MPDMLTLWLNSAPQPLGLLEYKSANYSSRADSRPWSDFVQQSKNGFYILNGWEKRGERIIIFGNCVN